MVTYKNFALGIAGVLAAASASAAPVTFFAENLSPVQSVPANVSGVRATFTSNLTSNVQSYGFETASNNSTAPLVASFTSSTSGSPISATLNGSGSVSTDTSFGRFNTTPGGSQFWLTSAGGNSSGAGGSFSISFGSAVSAFGFNGTDIGDFEGGLSLLLTPSGGGPDVTVNVPNTSGAASGSVLFFGFYDMATSYSKVTFLTSGSSSATDKFGFDDFIVADRGQIITPDTGGGGGKTPEPTSLALVGLALAAAGYSSRRKA
jgi:hypothetical protein